MPISTKMMNSADNLENWMTLLPQEIRNTPIIFIAIPGSHDSMSYGITKNAPVAPDAPSFIGELNKIMPCVIRRWAITQTLNTTEQLLAGIRYFDLRFSKSKNSFYFVHGLYCEEIIEPLKEIKIFLDQHTKEFVILDCQHFYDFADADYQTLADIILNIFANKIYDNAESLDKLTLEKANAKDKQVLIVYRTNIFVPSQFWKSNWMPSPWPNKTSATKLRKYLDVDLERRTNEIGYVRQCVLTPSVNYIVPRFMSSLRNTCAKQVRKELFDWIKMQTPGSFLKGDRPTSNVFIADFIDLRDAEFSRIVIGLNNKLLQNSSRLE